MVPKNGPSTLDPSFGTLLKFTLYYLKRYENSLSDRIVSIKHPNLVCLPQKQSAPGFDPETDLSHSKKNHMLQLHMGVDLSRCCDHQKDCQITYHAKG